mgnify:CR=1 FL=1
MFIGHYGMALALKRAEPKLSLGTLFIAVQLVDIAWGATILLGLERVQIHPGWTAATPLQFVYYPITHSLLAAGLWAAAAAVAWYTTREREEAEVLPWDHIDSGLDKEWLWQDWLDSLDETEVEDCRWTPCFDCGVCPQMGTQIEIGPTGKSLLPLTVLGAGRAELAEAVEHSHA